MTYQSHRRLHDNRPNWPFYYVSLQPSEDGACAGHPGLRQLGTWHRLLDEEGLQHWLTSYYVPGAFKTLIIILGYWFPRWGSQERARLRVKFHRT